MPVLSMLTAVRCTKPNTPAHASISPDVSDINYNHSITYVCDPGYNRTYGDETRRCTKNATFEGVEANCTRMYMYQIVVFFPLNSFLLSANIVLFQINF